MQETLLTKDREFTPVSQCTLETKLDHIKVQMRQEIHDCLGSKHFRSLVQIEVYKILQRYLILIGVISIILIVLLSLSNLADKGESREALAPTHSFSERP